MANQTSVSGVLKISTNTVAEFNGGTLTISRGTIENGNLNTTAKKFLPADAYEWSISCTCWWDDTDTNGQEALQSALLAGTEVEAHWLPEGTTTGDEDYNGQCLVTSISVELGKDTVVGRSIELQGTGAITVGTAA